MSLFLLNFSLPTQRASTPRVDIEVVSRTYSTNKLVIIRHRNKCIQIRYRSFVLFYMFAQCWLCTRTYRYPIIIIYCIQPGRFVTKVTFCHRYRYIFSKTKLLWPLLFVSIYFYQFYRSTWLFLRKKNSSNWIFSLKDCQNITEVKKAYSFYENLHFLPQEHCDVGTGMQYQKCTIIKQIKTTIRFQLGLWIGEFSLF